MTKETLKPAAEQPATQVFYLPELGISVEATSIEEAVKIAMKGDQENGN